MKNTFFLIFIVNFILTIFPVQATTPDSLINVKKEMALAGLQLQAMLKDHPDITQFPFTVKPDGKLSNKSSSWWCSGFFPGSLWYMYEFTGDTKWKKQAEKWTHALSKEQFNKSTHDLGFMLYCSYGNANRLSPKVGYDTVLLNGASSLATRFDPARGVIKSWDHDADKWKFPVIIDNMMNLEFLLWAAQRSGNKQYRDMAISHADKTLQNHFRKDNSCYHVICYDEQGVAFAKKNHQGYNDDSSWSRGQAWALYGYTVMFRETGLKRYLNMAEKAAAYILENSSLPADKIPYWDYKAPQIPNEERDASAAAVTASALLELQQFMPSKKQYYINQAELILRSLSSDAYRAKAGENNNFLLKHSVSFKNQGIDVDKPLVYADYYYLEALLRYSRLKTN